MAVPEAAGGVGVKGKPQQLQMLQLQKLKVNLPRIPSPILQPLTYPGGELPTRMSLGCGKKPDCRMETGRTCKLHADSTRGQVQTRITGVMRQQLYPLHCFQKLSTTVASNFTSNIK